MVGRPVDSNLQEAADTVNIQRWINASRDAQQLRSPRSANLHRLQRRQDVALFKVLQVDDAEERGIQDCDWAGVASRSGDTVLRARVRATNCPEYKVTAVQVNKATQVAWRLKRTCPSARRPPPARCR